MLPQHNPLAERDGNHLYNHKLYPYKRRLIVDGRKFGGTAAEIAKELNLPLASV